MAEASGRGIGERNVTSQKVDRNEVEPDGAKALDVGKADKVAASFGVLVDDA